MNGTTWVAPGEGATAGRLIDFIRFCFPGCEARSEKETGTAIRHLKALGGEHVTNLALNGLPLNFYDLRRIEVCD